MTRIDPIIAVKNVELSAKWYSQIFNFNNAHGGDHFSVLKTEDGEIILCLHKWKLDNHPTMMHPEKDPGNGLILYFRTDKMETIRENVISAGCRIEEDIHLNPNSRKREFSFRDPDGYFLSITEFHEYEG